MGTLWRVHWKLVQLGAFPAVCLNAYPSFGDGEQLCLLKCKFPLTAALVVAAAADWDEAEKKGEVGGGERCMCYRQDLSFTMQRLADRQHVAI